MNPLFLIFSFIFGSIIGSFLNVVILRLPNEQSLDGRSKCANCHRTLTTLDLFPIFSYMFLKGRCRSCGVRISPRYWLIELFTAVAFLFTVWFINPTDLISWLNVVKIWSVISILVCVFVIDLEHFIILDEIIIFGCVAVSFINLLINYYGPTPFLNLNGVLVSGFVAALVASAPFFLIWFLSSGKWMGFGDVKLALFLGIALGFPNVIVGIMLSIFIGGFFSVILLGFTNSNLKTKLPFGTFLAIGTTFALFFGTYLLNWYLSILGF